MEEHRPMPRRLLATTLAAAALAAPTAPARADARDEMVRQVNAFRAAHGVPPFRPAARLERSAQRYARRQLARGYVAHMGIAPSGRFRRVGEALEWHTGRALRIRAVVRGWARSPSHRALLLSRSFRWAGAGVARGTLNGRRAVVWVLHLGGR
jgi:uncharacterized protein YkwD